MPRISAKSLSRSAGWAAVFVFLFLCPARIAAIPISEYQQHLKEAITSLETLSEVDEDDLPSDYETQFNDTLEHIRTTLPQNQTVESDGEVYKVNNFWLHQALDELKLQSSRFERLHELLDRLRAMDARLTERQDPTQALETKDDARNRLKGILARPEYATTVQGPNALTRLLRDFAEWLRKFLPKPRTAQPGSAAWLNVVAKILVALAALALVVFLAKLLLSRFKSTKRIKPRKTQEARIVLGERLEPDQTATDLLSEAEALARNGDLRAAIRKAYIALLVELGDRKIISLAQHKTNRDYLNGLRDLPPLHSRMMGLTTSFERHWYGFVEASQSDWQNFRDGYLAALQKGN
jgi:hypothetical protein